MKPATAMLFLFFLTAISGIWFLWSVNWKIAIGIILVVWADNLGNSRRRT